MLPQLEALLVRWVHSHFCFISLLLILKQDLPSPLMVLVEALSPSVELVQQVLQLILAFVPIVEMAEYFDSADLLNLSVSAVQFDVAVLFADFGALVPDVVLTVVLAVGVFGQCLSCQAKKKRYFQISPGAFQPFVVVELQVPRLKGLLLLCFRSLVSHCYFQKLDSNFLALGWMLLVCCSYRLPIDY